MRTVFTPILCLVFIACSGGSADQKPTDSKAKDVPSEDAAVNALNIDAFLPALEAPAASQDATQIARIDLGRHLYYDVRLSSNDSISCNSCHLLDKYGVDGEDFSKGVPGTKVGRNSPTVYNAAGHIAQFWDGRAADLEEQAKGPILAGKEMGMPSPEAVVEKLSKTAEYPGLFAKAFPDEDTPLTYDNVGTAIGAFERNLITPSKWDDYLKGDKTALSEAEVNGARTFMEVGCTACHSGTLLGGNMYQKVGLIEPWPNQEDQGRFGLTQNDADKMMFKVPSLRNIEKTAPYFHDSSATTLEDAVRKMAKHQLGKSLDDQQVTDITIFLNTLTGPLPEAYIAPRPIQ